MQLIIIIIIISTKSPFEFVFQCCEFIKVIVYSKGWCEMFVLKPKLILCDFIRPNMLRPNHPYYYREEELCKKASRGLGRGKWATGSRALVRDNQ